MRWFLLPLVVLCLALVPGCAWQASQAQSDPQAAVTLLALNVGKADCLILAAQGRYYMVDTGTVQAAGRVRAALEALEISHLNGIFITHGDKDHLGGLAPLLAGGVTCDKLYASPMTSEKKHPLADYQVTWLAAGDRVPLSDTIYFQVLGPLYRAAEENNNSLVMAFHSPHGNILLPGDMLAEEEAALLNAGAFPACQVLKVAYHGGDKSTSQALLDAVNPQVAVISTNTREREETPGPQVTARLRQGGVAMLVTQEAQGAVRVTLPGPQGDYVAFANIPEDILPLRLESLDTADELISLSNPTGETVSLKGWYLYSHRGDECFFFPPEARIPGAGFLAVGTQSTQGAADFVWPEKNVIHNKKDDILTLYDPWGRAVSHLGNGL